MLSVLVLGSNIDISHAQIIIDASNYQDYIVITGNHVTTGDLYIHVDPPMTYSRAISSTRLKLWFLPSDKPGGRYIDYSVPLDSTPDCPQEVLSSPINQLDEPFIRWVNQYINSSPIIPAYSKVGDFKNPPIEHTVLNNYLFLACAYNRYERKIVYGVFRNVHIHNPPEGDQTEEAECVPRVLNVVVLPSRINFGMLDRNKLLEGVNERIHFHFSDDLHDRGCKSNLKPVIRFSSVETVIDNEIHLSNGTILSLYSRSLNTGNEEGRVPLNTPVTDIDRAGYLYNMPLEVKLRTSPDKRLIAGPFSTTIVYQIEYR